MSLFDCIQRAMDDDGPDGVKASRERGERAQAEWKRISDQYEAAGHPRHTAEALAAEDVKQAFRREYGDKRHIYLSVVAFQRKAQANVANSKAPNMVRRMEELESKRRGLVRRFNGRLSDYLNKHHRDILGRVTNAADQAALADELVGLSTGNASAKALADGVRDALEDLRLMFNEAGGIIPKMKNWDMPHTHNSLAVRKAGFDTWFSAIDRRLDWDQIVDPLTGKPMMKGADGRVPEAARRSYLKEAWRNIVFSTDASVAVYGRPKGVATYRKHTDQRHLHFKSGKDWLEYNRDFGTGGIHEALMGHVHRMARDITLMREFGPNPKLGAEYEADLWRQKAKKTNDTAILKDIDKDTARAMRMMNVLSGGNVPTDPMDQWVATFMSSTRHVVSAAHLDRAIVASLSDMNTMRLAASSMGMNPKNMLAKQLGLMKSLSKAELARAGWVADTLADAGTALARFQQEVAPREWAERVSQMSMRIQGLAAWTDRARATAYFEFGGFMASQMDRGLNDLTPELRAHLRKWKVTEADWNEFRRAEHLFTADNGATFLVPVNFRNATTLDARKADDLFFKMQGAAEEWLELAVPTGSIWAQGFLDPSAHGMTPGTLFYELAKSGLMFKSFPMTFTVNQYRQIMARGGFLSKGGAGYAFNLAAGATVLGGISLQLGDMLLGRDPQDMTRPDFWARAAMKGGGFGIIGDIITTGASNYGSGYADYLAGPMAQLADDVFSLTAMNAYQALMGEETNFGKDLARFGKRYTPMGQTPIIGPAMDRLFWDQLQLLLDPDAGEDMAQASAKRKRDYGSGEFWMPGDALPGRLPNLGAAFGQ